MSRRQPTASIYLNRCVTMSKDAIVPFLDSRLNLTRRRLGVEGVPFFGSIMPYHDDMPQTVRMTGAYVVWVPHLDNNSLIASRRRE